MRERTFAPLVVVGALLGLAGCGGGDDPPASSVAVAVNEERCLDAPEAEAPRIEWLEGALLTAESQYGSAPEYFEISVDRQRVSLIVAAESGDAEQSFFCGDDGYGPPESLGPASGATFVADDIDIDEERIFAGIETELDDPTIIDFVIQGAPDGVIYDATVQSDAGGILLILLSGQGDILAVQTT